MPLELTPPTTVAILGSCVTRDVFNRDFVPGYADLFKSVAYGGQTSLLSLMDEPVALPDLSDLGEGDRGEVVKEFARRFLDDVRSTQPAYLILDFFADVHFGCIEWDGRLVSRNRWKFLKSAAYKAADDTPELLPGTDDYAERWTAALDQFLAFLANESAGTRVILHRARNVRETVHADGSIGPYGSAKDTKRMNAWWERLDKIVEGRGIVRVIDVTSEDTRTLDDHPWGPFYIHFAPAYSQRFFAALARVALTDARAVPARRGLFSRLGHRTGRADQTA